MILQKVICILLIQTKCSFVPYLNRSIIKFKIVDIRISHALNMKENFNGNVIEFQHYDVDLLYSYETNSKFK